jgi:DNA-binding HxlR family transcriptional regulator
MRRYRLRLIYARSTNDKAAPPDERPTMNDRPDDIAYLREVLNHRYVVETLDALSSGPCGIAALTATVRGSQRALAHALRMIAARGLIMTDRRGSWDHPHAPTDVIQLTDRGRQTVEALSSLTVWMALYEDTDHVRDR